MVSRGCAYGWRGKKVFYIYTDGTQHSVHLYTLQTKLRLGFSKERKKVRIQDFLTFFNKQMRAKWTACTLKICKGSEQNIEGHTPLQKASYDEKFKLGHLQCLCLHEFECCLHRAAFKVSSTSITHTWTNTTLIFWCKKLKYFNNCVSLDFDHKMRQPHYKKTPSEPVN